MTLYSLAQLTVLEASPPELIRLASNAGYNCVGLRLLEVTGGDAWPLASDKELRQSTKQSLSDYGVEVLDVELVRLTPEVDVAALLPTVEVAADLGAKHMLTQAHDNDWNRLCDNFHRLCELLADYRLTADVEFLTWTEMRGVNDVLRLLDAVGRPNVGITVDTLHFYRSGCSLHDLDSVPQEMLHFAQFSDAPAVPPSSKEGLIKAAREERLNPGAGELDLRGLIKALPKDIAIAVEIPNTCLAARMPVERRIREALEATKMVVESVKKTDPSRSVQMDPLRSTGRCEQGFDNTEAE